MSDGVEQKSKIASFLWDAVKVIGGIIFVYWLWTSWYEQSSSTRLVLGVGIGAVYAIWSLGKEVDQLTKRVSSLESRLANIPRQPPNDYDGSTIF